jgi:putative hydrolase of the HAD superfamily
MKLCIFDVGGVMVDGFDVSPAIAAHLGFEREALLPLLEEAGYQLLHAGHISSVEYWERFSSLTGISVTEELWGKFFQPARRPGMYGLVRELQQAGHRVVGGTNTLDSHYEIHSAAGDYDVFDATYASNLIKHAKPDAGFYRHILEAEGVKPEEAVFIDDMPVNVEAANRLGIQGILFESEAALRAGLATSLARS